MPTAKKRGPKPRNKSADAEEQQQQQAAAQVLIHDDAYDPYESLPSPEAYSPIQNPYGLTPLISFDQFSPVVQEAILSVRRKKRQRSLTPEDAEEIMINSSRHKMSDMCRDMKQGRRSQRHREIQVAEQKRRQRQQQRSGGGIMAGLETATTTSVDGESELDKDRGAQSVPQTKVIGERIVVDTASLQVDRQAQALPRTLEYVEEGGFAAPPVNSATHRNKPKVDRWDIDSTNKFYKALSQFGTDFGLIAHIFVGKSRRQIKQKFNLEERRHPMAIEAALRRRLPIDLDLFSKDSGKALKPMEEVQDELEQMQAEFEEAKRNSHVPIDQTATQPTSILV